MRRFSRYSLLVLLLLLQIPFNVITQGYVLHLDSQNRPLQWQLAPPYGWTSNTVFNPQTQAIRYYLAQDAYSEANRTNELNAVRASFAQWQFVPGTRLKFEDAGLVPFHAVGYDNTNLVFWTKNSNLTGYDDVSGAVAVAVYTMDLDYNLMAECDIIVNGVQYRWSSDLQPTDGTFAIEPVLLHEIGHLIGLDHSPLGGAMMMPFGDTGGEMADGLTPDEISGAQSLYPDPNYAKTLSTLRGYVTKNGVGVLGAVITLQDAQGTLLAGTLTRAGGGFELASQAPGNYQVRVSPLDAAPTQGNTGASLIWGYVISDGFGGADTAFLPTALTSVTLIANQVTSLNLPVSGGNAAFRITRFLPPQAVLLSYTEVNTPFQLVPGQSDVYIGIYSPTLPTSGATLSVTGNGLSLESPVCVSGLFFPGVGYLNLIAARARVAADARPGMRTLVVQKGSDIAYANGFLKIQNPAPDANYDGLSDTFQRQYFSWFLSPQAAPLADPDGDGMPNWAEYAAGTNPVDPFSKAFRLQRIRNQSGNTVLSWHGSYGQQYRVLASDLATGGAWQEISAGLVGWGGTLDWPVPSNTEAQRFYRLEAIK